MTGCESPCRSVLFVGALQLDALTGALTSGADAVCIDLEDAVPAASKRGARASVLRVLDRRPVDTACPIIVRINSVRTLAGIADLQAFIERPTGARALVLPKMESGDELELADALAADGGSPLRFIAIIETARGLDQCAAIARASARLDALFFGGFDLSTALGADYGWEPLLYARSRVVHAAAAASVQVLDSPYPDIADTSGLQRSCALARTLGMSGKVAKQATQIASINACFTATPDEIRRARDIVAAFAAEPTRALVVDGKLVELPSIKRLQRVALLKLPDEP